jgi:hypothetical protein
MALETGNDWQPDDAPRITLTRAFKTGIGVVVFIAIMGGVTNLSDLHTAVVFGAGVTFGVVSTMFTI